MGTRGWHLSRAQHHRETADFLSTAEGGKFLDWALVALFYAAHHQVHSCLSGQPGLGKDERHPRKHTSHRDPASGGRGTNQLVKDCFRPIYRDYINLFEISHRSRYDVTELGDEVAYKAFTDSYEHIVTYVAGTNKTRPDIPTEAP